MDDVGRERAIAYTKNKFLKNNKNRVIGYMMIGCDRKCIDKKDGRK